MALIKISSLQIENNLAILCPTMPYHALPMAIKKSRLNHVSRLANTAGNVIRSEEQLILKGLFSNFQMKFYQIL